jgi:hypothetical protein
MDQCETRLESATLYTSFVDFEKSIVATTKD